VMAAGRDRLERALRTMAACCGWVGRVAVDLEVLARALRLAAELALAVWEALDLWAVVGGGGRALRCCPWGGVWRVAFVWPPSHVASRVCGRWEVGCPW
jgi:hypothetical protein